MHDHWHLLESPSPLPPLPIENDKLRAVFARRGVEDGEAFRRFVAPAMDDLHDPSTIHGIGHACERIERAVRDKETILIYGDYDVDGVTSIVLLQTVLRSLGADAAHVVPHRLVDGYGLKTEVIDRVLVDKDVKLVITVDCGITSVDPVRKAIERGIDVIITDHHLPPGTLPSAAAVLNPKQPGCEYPFKELAGVGVAFKLCCELIRRNSRKIAIRSLLKIAAIGTIADVAPLVGENRTIVRLGLDGLTDARNRGLRALLKRLGLSGRAVRASDVGFKIGPRINAAGRLASADTAIQLFAAQSDDAAWELCAELDRMNAERQEIEQQVRAAAEEQIGGASHPAFGHTLPAARGEGRVLVLAGDGWHKGVLGLTAGRIAQKHYRPALVIGIENGHAVGSARSIRGVNLHAQLEGVADLFTHFGGHELACGFSLPTANLPALRERLAEQFRMLDDEVFVRTAFVDAELTLAELDARFLEAHEMLQPFGNGNPQPLFLARGIEVTGTRTFAEDCCELSVQDGTARGAAVLWPSVKELGPELVRGRVDLLFQVEPNTYAPNGVRLSIVDARRSA
ncbi:MAG TPA: single-stranded-DNA-specific exonuclease RecJ [Thermoanaerobaculia bacterium]|nr:single-stranded-DNA-specific exonuclease RecJ [Thermoanaerobaculia bacterium]